MNGRGQKVAALISPAGVLAGEKYESGVAALEKLGFEVRPSLHVNRKNGCAYTAGSARERAVDLEAAYADAEADVVWCVRGGYGSAEMLDEVDWNLLCRRPDLPVVGYSDITALHFALWKFGAGLPVAAPMLGKIDEVLNDVFSREFFLKLWDRPMESKREVIFGNLTVAASLCGTRYLPSAAGKTVIFEDVNEMPYRLDRMFNQLWQSGFFDGVKRLCFGHFSDCSGGNPGAEVPVLQKWNQIINHGADMVRVAYGHSLPFRSLRADRSWKDEA